MPHLRSLSSESEINYCANPRLDMHFGLDPSYLTFNPLSANSDQKQFSPNYIIQSLSRDNVMRINKMIRLEGKCHDLLSNSLK